MKNRVFAVILVLCLAVGLAGCVLGASQPIATQAPALEPIYEDGFVKVSFIELFDAEGVSGVSYLRLLVVNKTDQKISIIPTDASVNKYQTMLMSGTMMEIKADEKSQNPFIISHANIDANSASEIQSVEFIMQILNDDMDEIGRTGMIAIERDAVPAT